MKNKLNQAELGKRIRQYRKEKKLTQAQLAESISSNQEYISKIETGKQGVNASTLIAIAKALQIPVALLIADYSDSNDENRLQLIFDDIKGMSDEQLEMLQEQLKIIKKFK